MSQVNQGTPVQQSFLGRYRALVVAIGLFLVLDIGVVGYSLYTSFKVSQQTDTLNIERRLNNLAINLPASLLSIQNDQLQGVETDPDILSAFQLDIVNFNAITNALLNGGQLAGANGKPVVIEKLANENDRQAIENLQSPYDFFTSLGEQLKKNGDLSQEDLASAVPYFQANRTQFADVISKLSENIEASRSTLAGARPLTPCSNGMPERSVYSWKAASSPGATSSGPRPPTAASKAVVRVSRSSGTGTRSAGTPGTSSSAASASGSQRAAPRASRTTNSAAGTAKSAVSTWNLPVARSPEKPGNACSTSKSP